jgi:hypothetical protein
MQDEAAQTATTGRYHVQTLQAKSFHYHAVIQHAELRYSVLPQIASLKRYIILEPSGIFHKYNTNKRNNAIQHAESPHNSEAFCVVPVVAACTYIPYYG